MENEENNVVNTENVQPQVEQTTTQTAQQPTGNGGANKIISWAKANIKLLAIIAAVILVIIVVVAIVNGSGPKSAVKNYVKAFSSFDAKKVVSKMDVKGAIAYKSSSEYDENYDRIFKEDKFEENYKNVKDDEAKEYKEGLIDSFDEMAKTLKEKKYSIKLLSFKSVEQSKTVKNLYTIEAKLRIESKDEDGDKQSITGNYKFVVYKGKIIFSEL